MNRIVIILTAAAVVAAGMAGVAAAQTPPPSPVDGRGQVILSWDEFVKITGYDPTRKGEQVVTVPWSQVEELLGVKVEAQVKQATVDLPWPEFKALLEWSVTHKEGKQEAPPPTDYIITSAEYKGTLSDEKAEFEVVMKINILREKGWKRVPLLPGTVALVSSTVLPAEGMYINSSSNMYELLTDKSGPTTVTLKFAVAVQKSAGTNQVAFPRVAPGSAILDLTIDRKSVDVTVAGAQKTVPTTAGEETKVAAALPTGVPVSVSWEAAIPKVEAAPTKLYAETRTVVTLAEGMLICDEMVNYNILHTGVRELKLTVPEGVSVLGVSGPNVQDWRVTGGRDLQVVLRSETIGSYGLRLSYEGVTKDTVKVPVVRPVGVEREKGYIAVVAVSNVEVDPAQVTGAAEVDVRQLPADVVAMTSQPILLGFRYVAEAFDISLALRRHEEVGVLVTIVDAGLFTAMQLPDGRRITKVVYTIRNNRNQFLRLKMPDDAEIWSVGVSGNTVAPAKDDQGNLLVPLIRSEAGAAELAAFPVDIVYVEAPKEKAGSAGTIRVELPGAAVPVMHLMYNYYLPAEGKYTVGWGKSGFSGPLHLVDQFATLSTGPAAEVVRFNADQQAAQMQQQVDVQVDTEARRAGATPIRVRLPINGKLFRLEKILALPQDHVWFQVEYRDWKTE